MAIDELSTFNCEIKDYKLNEIKGIAKVTTKI